jgi:hypothetical protein
MAAPPFLGQLFYQLGTSGWSQTFWLPGSSYSAAATQLQNIAVAQQAISFGDVQCVATRVSDPFVFRDVLLSVLSPPLVGNLVPTATDATLPPEMALRMRQFVGVKPYSLRWLHGIPMSQQNKGVYTPTAVFTTGLNAVVQAWATNSVLVQKKGVVPPGPYTGMTISTIVPENFRSRRVGRPFFLYRGKQRAH